MDKEKFIRSFRKIFPDTPVYGKIELGLRILMIFVVFTIFLAQGKQIFSVPIDKPYYTGKWDEPFAINAGITALREKGDPNFYNYGGTSVYPYSIVYYYYCQENNINPAYKVLDKKFVDADWPMTRKIHPVKPIYITRVIAHILFLLGGFLYSGLFVFFLLPVPFWLISSIKESGILYHYGGQMLPETHLGILAGFTSIAFIKAVLEKEISRYFIWVAVCAAMASFTVGAKINAAYIVLLPLSLGWRLVKEKYTDFKRISILAGAIAVPYILVNPASVLDIRKYYRWINTMRELSGSDPTAMGDNSHQIKVFMDNIYLAKTFPLLLLAALVLAAAVLLIRRNWAAFAGLALFLGISFYTISNMKHDLYARHFVFLLLPINILVLYPLIHFYGKAPKSLKAGVTLVCLVITLWWFPPGETIRDISNLGSQHFSTKWKIESRDHLEAFVKEKQARVYFYDFHGFSLPDTIYSRLIPFSDPVRLPEKLEENEYVAFIKYKIAKKERANRNGDYNRAVADLMKRYKPVKVFGPRGGAHDINDAAPLKNPTIVLLKEK